MNSTEEPATELDTTGLLCPIPVVKISRSLNELDPGEILKVTADDPAFPDDLRAWIESHPHELVFLEENGGTFQAVIRKNRRVGE